MHPITFRTTSDKFIISIDKKWVDGKAFIQFIEKLKLKIQSKDVNLEETLEQLNFDAPK